MDTSDCSASTRLQDRQDARSPGDLNTLQAWLTTDSGSVMFIVSSKTSKDDKLIFSGSDLLAAACSVKPNSKCHLTLSGPEHLVIPFMESMKETDGIHYARSVSDLDTIAQTPNISGSRVFLALYELLSGEVTSHAEPRLA